MCVAFLAPPSGHGALYMYPLRVSVRGLLALTFAHWERLRTYPYVGHPYVRSIRTALYAAFPRKAYV